ncbi:MAG: recombinase family protein [Bacilli bacterium]|nr:recombinase family protein [Bacilli bacterium]
MIREILTNEVYIGNMCQGKIKKPIRRLDKRVKTKKEDWILVENTHEPIISKNDFETVKRMLEYSPTMLKSDDILLRYLKCPDCGSKFYKRKAKYNEYYYCNNYYRNKKCSSSHSIVKSMLEGIVLEDLKHRLNKDVKELTKELVEQNINKIYVYENGKVEIDYKNSIKW